MNEESVYNLIMEVCRVRDRLQLILDGKLERRIRPAAGVDDYRCGGTTGFRKLTLKDAREIITYAIPRLNKAVNAVDLNLDHE